MKCQVHKFMKLWIVLLICIIDDWKNVIYSHSDVSEGYVHLFVLSIFFSFQKAVDMLLDNEDKISVSSVQWPLSSD